MQQNTDRRIMRNIVRYLTEYDKKVMISAGRHIEKTLLTRITGEEKANLANKTRQNLIQQQCLLIKRRHRRIG